MSRPTPRLTDRYTPRLTDPTPGDLAAPRTDDIEQAEEIRQLWQAVKSRSVIDQARGMIMALGPCPRDAAWDVLVEMSQHTNAKLRDVARALVATTDGVPLPAALQYEMGRAFQRLRTPVAGR